MGDNSARCRGEGVWCVVEGTGMRLLIRLHVWQDSQSQDCYCFYGEKTVEIPVFPAVITIHGQVWKQEDTDGFVPCYNVDSDAYTLDVDTTLSPDDFDDYVEHVRAIGFVDPCENDEQ